MKVAFIVDTSLLMHVRAENGLSYIDMAIGAIETFVASRSKISNRSNDKYFLLSTSEDYPEMILSSWEDSIEHFLGQLKLLKTKKTMNALHVALGHAFSLLSEFRGTSAQSDTITGGRLISRAETTLVSY